MPNPALLFTVRCLLVCLVGSAGLGLCGASPALGQDTVGVSTPYLHLRVSPEQGTLVLTVRDTSGADERQTVLPGFYLNGVRQQNFSVQARAPQSVLENADVRLRLEVLTPRAIRATWTPRDAARHDLRLHLRSSDETAYYGTGERFDALDQRGYIVPMQVDDRYGNKGVGAYKPVPFVMSTQGFGLWVDRFAPALFDLSGSERFLTALHLSDSALSVVFFAGPDPASILRAYTEVTGRPPLPPPWAFGLWKSRDIHHNQDSVMVDLQKLRRHDIPASVLVLDSPWETGYNDFEVNRTQFPRPDAMFEAIQRMGMYLCLWLTPFVNTSNVQEVEGIDARTSTYDEAAARGYLITDSTDAVAQVEWWKGRGGLIDFTNPAAVAWWYEQLDKTQAYGVRAFKADDGEGNFVPDATFHDGTPAYIMKNRYAALYDSVMQAYIDTRLGGDGTLITRSGYSGTHRVPFDWAGDNHGSFSYADGLPSVIIAGQNAALSGIAFWGSDIAGYAGTPSKEVFIRWAQFGAFSPLMQVHMTSNLGPWDFDAETLRIFRRFARLRTELFPYLYNAAHEATRTGMPIMRPMVLAFPDDAEAHRHVYQYLFGPDLLVAPMYQPGTSRAVYVPEGSWIDYWTGQAYKGPQTIMMQAPLDRMPLLVRGGAIVPRVPDDLDTLIPRHADMDASVTALDDRRILQVWPEGAGQVETWDGLSATQRHTDSTTTLRVQSRTERPLVLYIMHRNLSDLQVPDATVRTDSAGTIVEWDTFGGDRTLEWPRESPRP